MLDDLGDEVVTHHVRLVHRDELDSFDSLQDPLGLHKAGVLVAGQVDLGYIASNEELGVLSHAGEKHLKLGLGGILRLVQDDVGIVERAAAHEGQRGDFTGFVLQIRQQLGHRHHVAERIVERLEVGVELVAEVAGQEAEVFTRLHRRTGEDDTLHLLVLQGTHRQGHRGIGLARPCRTDGKHHIIVFQTLD